MDRRLSRGVGPADDIRVPAGHRLSYGRGTAVVDPRPVERLERRDAEAPVSGAGREEKRAPSNAPAIQERHDQPLPVTLDRARGVHEDELRAEDPRLLEGRLGEGAAADAARETEVVADERARRRLTADPAVVDHERADALGRA